MKARHAFLLVLGICLGTGMRALATDSVLSEQGPNHYQPLEKHRVENQMKTLKKDHMTQKDLSDLSADVHGVNILILSPSDSNAIPASSRPKGSLQLDKVVIVDPN